MLTEMCTALRIKSYTNHCVRSSCIRILRRNGFSDRQISKPTGHRTIERLSNYDPYNRVCDKLQMTDALQGQTNMKMETNVQEILVVKQITSNCDKQFDDVSIKRDEDTAIMDFPNSQDFIEYAAINGTNMSCNLNNTDSEEVLMADVASKIEFQDQSLTNKEPEEESVEILMLVDYPIEASKCDLPKPNFKLYSKSNTEAQKPAAPNQMPINHF